MKDSVELKANRVPHLIIDKSLDRLNSVVLFPDKVEKAKETIARIGLPKKTKDN